MKKNRLLELRKKADKRKNNPQYRHEPNNIDIVTATDHTKLTAPEQYKAMVRET